MTLYHFIRSEDTPSTWLVCNQHSFAWKLGTYFFIEEAETLIEKLISLDLPAHIYQADDSGVPYTKLEYAFMIMLCFDNDEDEAAFMLLASDGLEL